MLINWIMIYTAIGAMCGLCFDILFNKLDIDPPTIEKGLLGLLIGLSFYLCLSMVSMEMMMNKKYFQ